MLVPWTIYLSFTLRERHRVTMWNFAWVGFDVLLLLSFAASAWAVWKRRLVAAVFLSASALLLVVDVWFDVTLSWGTRGQYMAIATAALFELPLCALLVVTVRNVLVRLSNTAAALRGEDAPTGSVLSRPMPMGMTPVAADHTPARDVDDRSSGD